MTACIQPCTKEAFPPCRISCESGFSLIEVMMALFLFAVAVSALTAAQSAGIKTLTGAGAHHYASITANNEMVRTLSSSSPLIPGFTRGSAKTAGGEFLWQRHILETGTHGLVRIEISVTAPASPQVLFELVSLRRQRGQREKT